MPFRLHTIRIALVAASLLTLQSCAVWESAATRNAADPLLPDAGIGVVDLFTLLDPTDRGGWEDAATPDKKLAAALNGFYLEDATTAPSRRNRLQDLLLASSDHEFHKWRTDLRSLVTGSHFGLDFMQVVLSGLSTILTPPATKTALSGAATILGGTESAIDTDFLADRTLDVIVKGMETRRITIMTEIEGKRTLPGGATSSIEAYTVEAAIRDALRYHAAASVTAGIEESEAATQQAKAAAKAAQTTGQVALRVAPPAKVTPPQGAR